MDSEYLGLFASIVERLLLPKHAARRMLGQKLLQAPPALLVRILVGLEVDASQIDRVTPG